MEKKIYYYLVMMHNEKNAIPRILLRVENYRVLFRLMNEAQFNPDFALYVENENGERAL